jgi:hypothetical protein
MNISVPPTFSSVTAVRALFDSTFETVASYGSLAVTAISAHIIPITVGVIGVSLALVYLWKKVYGAEASPAKPPKISTKERLENELKSLPQITHLEPNHFKTRAKHDKLEQINGQFFCHFDTDRDGFKANERYPVIGWMAGKEKNTYIILEKPADSTTVSTPRTEENADSISEPTSPRPAEEEAKVPHNEHHNSKRVRRRKSSTVVEKTAV